MAGERGAAAEGIKFIVITTPTPLVLLIPVLDRSQLDIGMN